MRFSIIFLSLLLSLPLPLVAAESSTNNSATEKSETANANKNQQQQNGDKKQAQKKQTTTSEIAAPVDSFEQQKSDINHYLSKEKIKPVLVGIDDYTTLIETNNSANAKGVMILIPDWQQSAVTPKALNYLRSQLPEQGWTTIAVHPPKKPDNYPSKAINLTEREQENSKTLKSYQESFAKLITQISDKASEYPGIIVMVVEGHNAPLLVNIYQQSDIEKPAAVIMLSGHLSTEKDNIAAAKNLSQTDLAVLDLWLKRDHPLVASSAKLRKKWVNQMLKINYRQKQLNNFNSSYYPNKLLVREISGWLKSLGW